VSRITNEQSKTSTWETLQLHILAELKTEAYSPRAFVASIKNGKNLHAVTKPDSFTPHSMKWVLVGRVEYRCKYSFLYATRMPCEEDHIFDTDKIRRIASELCNTYCNDRVAIIISGVQCNNRNTPNFSVN